MKTHSFLKRHPPFETHVKMNLQNETLINNKTKFFNLLFIILMPELVELFLLFLVNLESCPNYCCNNYNHFSKPLDPTQHNQ